MKPRAELAADPHFVTFSKLFERAEAAGMRLERRSGPAWGYFARFDKPPREGLAGVPAP